MSNHSMRIELTRNDMQRLASALHAASTLDQLEYAVLTIIPKGNMGQHEFKLRRVISDNVILTQLIEPEEPEPEPPETKPKAEILSPQEVLPMLKSCGSLTEETGPYTQVMCGHDGCNKPATSSVRDLYRTVGDNPNMASAEYGEPSFFCDEHTREPEVIDS